MHTINDIVILNNYIDRLGRIYDPIDLIHEIVTKAVFYGELDPEYRPHINFNRISHVVKNLRLEHNCLVGDLTLLNTPIGAIANQLIDQGIQLKTTIRAFGNVEHNTVKRLSLVAIDLVKDE